VVDVDKPVRVGLLGCGSVGSAFLGLLQSDAELLPARCGLRFEVVKVAVRDLSKDRGLNLPDGVLTHDANAVVVDPEVDIVVELIGGSEPARGLVTAALQAGKPVVTGNKELLANFGRELSDLASAKGVDLLYEAAVGGGIPLLRPLRESLAGERIRRVLGIVNGTTNYILTRMTEERASYAEALAEAQSLGYAEGDPTADVEGFDAAAKAAIVATIAFGCEVVAGDVYREGISAVSADDIEVADRLGYVVKLLAVAEAIQGGDGIDSVAVRVHPAMVPKAHPLASVRGSFNAVFIEGEAVGELMLYGRGAGGLPSASAVLGDLIDAAHNLRSGAATPTPHRPPAVIAPIDELSTQYYLNLDVLDRPGVLATVAEVFGEHRVSIRSMEQAGLGDDARLIFITHTARESDVQATVTGLHQLGAVKRVGSLLRVVGGE
jgi:homoserine dehydrogenase